MRRDERLTLSLLTCVVWSVGSGCIATGRFAVTVHHAGAYDPAKDRAVQEQAAALPWDRDYPVALYLHDTPEGLRLTNGKLEILPGYEDRYTLLGIIKSEHARDREIQMVVSMLWYVDMHEQHSKSRDLYCKVQTPLRTLTIGLWWAVVPLSWPCWIAYSKDEADNLPIHIQEIKRAATAMGANVVVLGGLGNDYVVSGSTRVLVTSYTVRAARASAFALVDRSAAQPAPP
ncbi:MAG: hypothetical protein L6Q95_02905 [Planctomycetes bacterium]|nr:hypothetical protein [Planctomycetota bacterium]